MMCTKITEAKILLLRRGSILAILAIQQTGQTTRVFCPHNSDGRCELGANATQILHVGGEFLVARLLAAPLLQGPS
jgi:hypothetical protein